MGHGRPRGAERGRRPLDRALLQALAGPGRGEGPPSPPRCGSCAGDEADFAKVFYLAAVLVADPEPVVHKAVGIMLKHAGARDPRAVAEFLDEYAQAMPHAAPRSAVDELDPHDQARFKP
jgi:hypothetical protein